CGKRARIIPPALALDRNRTGAAGRHPTGRRYAGGLEHRAAGDPCARSIFGASRRRPHDAGSASGRCPQASTRPALRSLAAVSSVAVGPTVTRSAHGALAKRSGSLLAARWRVIRPRTAHTISGSEA